MEISPLIKKPAAFRLADLYVEGLVVWTVLTLVTAATLLLPFLAGPQFILANAPACVSQQQFHVECLLCGMTRAFIAIAAGHFDQALALNGGSLLLYASFLLNAALYLVRGLPAGWRLLQTRAGQRP